MSQWTHVNAVIRWDGFSAMEDTFRPSLGKMYLPYDFDLYGDSPGDTSLLFPNCAPDEDGFIPCGSEGSLKYFTYRESGIGMRLWVSMIWGDLRDYNDKEAILEYFRKITEGRLIRSGILEINVEYQSTSVFRFDEGWKEVHSERNSENV